MCRSDFSLIEFIAAVEKWARSSNIGDLLPVLLEEGFTTVESIALIEERYQTFRNGRSKKYKNDSYVVRFLVKRLSCSQS